MNGNTNNSTGVGSSVGDDSRTRSCEFSNDIGAGTATGTTTTTPASSAAEESHEEECVICLEELSSQDWGRCTPCGHTFHKKCWWEWENAHNQRIDEQQRRLSGSGGGGGGRRSRRRSKDPGPKCCLCNTVNKQFLDRSGDEPAHNPSPYIASDDDPGVNNSGGGGNRFTNWFRDIGQEASGFVNFLQNNLGDNSGQPFPGRRSSTFRNSNGNVGGGGGGSGADSPSNANNNPFNLLLPGTEVVIQGLVNSPHLNQKRGVVVQYFPQSARYSIQLETNISNFIAGTNAPVAIKPENLLQTAKVKIHGLRSQPSLNGSTGTICAYSKERNRYVVKVDFMLVPTREISIQPCNILIPNGTCVRLEGLQQASQWNGKYGTIARWVESSNESSDTSNNNTTGGGRYEVRLSRQYGVRVKMENVRL